MIDNVDINKIQKELLEEDTIIDIAEPVSYTHLDLELGVLEKI